MDTSDKTVRLTYDGDLDWIAALEVCAEPKTVLTGCGDDISNALEDLASEIRLAEGKDEDEDEDEHPGGDVNAPVEGASEA